MSGSVSAAMCASVTSRESVLTESTCTLIFGFSSVNFGSAVFTQSSRVPPTQSVW